MGARFRAAWPHLRAGFIFFHLGAIFSLAFPAPVGGLNRGAWKDPTVQAELRAWAPRFGLAEPAFEDRLYAFASSYMAARDRVLPPFKLWAELTGCDQPWRMFIAPHRFPARFQVQSLAIGGSPDGWETLFEERNPAASWHAEYFSQERVRGLLFRFAWPSYERLARLHCDWLAAQVFAEQPGAGAVRCRFWKAASPSPEQVLAGSEPQGAWTQERSVTREELAR